MAIWGNRMTDSKLDDSDREAIIEAIDNTDKSQAEIGEKFGVSQSTVSNIKRTYEHGKEEGAKAAYEKTFDFSTADQTEKEEEDDYWCAYCENEGEGRVPLDYMQEECPNGHDLSGDW